MLWQASLTPPHLPESRVKHIDRTKTHLLFWQNIFGVVIIPLWAFPDHDAVEAFYSEAKEYQEAARGPGAAS